MAGSGEQRGAIEAACGVPGVRELRGGADASGMTFGLVVGRFHTELTSALTRSVVEHLLEAGASAGDIAVVWVPGTFEIPAALERWAADAPRSAFLALGCVVEGATTHAASIVDVVTEALSAISRACRVPVLDGLVAAPTLALAEARCRPGPDSRAPYLARAAVEAAHIHRLLQQGAPDHG
jgi:6,7-dimethyl-8-ribityllumazine synthase